MNMVRVLDKKTKRRIAAAAPCDPRTLEKLLRGGHVRGRAAKRARAALLAAGIDPDGGGDFGEKGAGGNAPGGLRVRSLPVVEVVGLRPDEMGGDRLFVSSGLWARATEVGTRNGFPDVVQVLRLVAEVSARRTRPLDDSTVAGSMDGIDFIASRDGRGGVLLQLEADVSTTIAGAVLDVVTECELDRDALLSVLLSANGGLS